MSHVDYPIEGRVEYSQLMKASAGLSDEKLSHWLWNELAYEACDAYVRLTPRRTDIVRIQPGPFEYVYDDYASLEAQGLVPHHPKMEARLVLAVGRSIPRMPKRDDARLRNWAGPSLKNDYGPGWDRGHFIAYSIGGIVDQFEFNVFVQRRSLNRGWKSHPQGTLYRKMEAYCAANVGTFCFSRPIYCDETAKPTYVDFGVLKSDGELWVESFNNQ